MVAADDRTAVIFSLSPGHASDGVEGRTLLEGWQDKPKALPKNGNRPIPTACLKSA